MRCLELFCFDKQPGSTRIKPAMHWMMDDLNVGCGQMDMHFHDLVGCRVSGL